MPPRSPTTVGIAVETTVISIAAIERLSNREMTVSGRFVFIVGIDAQLTVEAQISRQLTTVLRPVRERSPANLAAAAGRAPRPRPAPAPARPARARRPSCR